MQKFIVTIPLSLYIHLPWCVRKCPYCDFNSHEAKQDFPEDAYVTALLADLDQQLAHIWGRRIISIFFGGGTPSLFSPNAIEKILSGVHQRLNYGSDIEITLEANPGTVDAARFKGFRAAGVNRLSIGIQSLQDSKLHALGRIHDREYALRAIEAAHEANFTNFNLDLMHGLPNQSLQNAMQDVHDALNFQPPHLSWYQLTIEPNTFFHHQPPQLPEDDTLFEIQEQGKKVIQDAGLQQYEISAFAKPDHACVHNTNYWEFGDYLGIGAGAHSKLTNIEKQVITRHWQVKNPRDYLNPEKSFIAKQEVITEDDTRFEFMLNALRLIRGVSVDLFTERTGLSVATLEPMLSFAREKNLMVSDTKKLQATDLGLRYLNDVISLFLPKKI